MVLGLLVMTAEVITYLFAITDHQITQLKDETLKAEMEVCKSRTNYMRDVGNVTSFRGDFNVDGHIFEEIGIFKYFSVLITGKTKLVKKSRRGQMKTIYVVIVYSIF
jgi:hypothetical protein